MHLQQVHRVGPDQNGEKRSERGQEHTLAGRNKIPQKQRPL